MKKGILVLSAVALLSFSGSFAQEASKKVAVKPAAAQAAKLVAAIVVRAVFQAAAVARRRAIGIL